MDQTQASRLLTLAYYLKTEVKPQNFDMSYWGHKWVETPEEKETSCLVDLQLGQQVKHKQVKEITCGTSACALGWATVVFPEVMRLGSWDETMSDDEGNATEEEGHVEFKMGEDGWEWVDGYSPHIHDFFGITAEEGGDLFHDSLDATPKQKAKQIEDLVSKHGYTYAK